MLVLVIYFHFIFFGTDAHKELVSLLFFVIQKNLVAGETFFWKGEIIEAAGQPAPLLPLYYSVIGVMQ